MSYPAWAEGLVNMNNPIPVPWHINFEEIRNVQSRSRTDMPFGYFKPSLSSNNLDLQADQQTFFKCDLPNKNMAFQIYSLLFIIPSSSVSRHFSWKKVCRIDMFIGPVENISTLILLIYLPLWFSHKIYTLHKINFTISVHISTVHAQTALFWYTHIFKQ